MRPIPRLGPILAADPDEAETLKIPVQSQKRSALQASRRRLAALNQRILGPFITESSSGQQLSFIDGLRALACLAVIIYHCRTGAALQLPVPLSGGAMLNFTPIVNGGRTGVYLFFVLSGFLLAQTWLRADLLGKTRPSLRQYAKLRIFRICPVYYTVILFLLAFFIGGAIKSAVVYSSVGVRSLLAHMLFLQLLYPPSSDSFGGVSGQFWTLSVEMTFYAMLPLLILGFTRRRWIISLPVAAAISLAYAWFCFQPSANTLETAVYNYSQRAGAVWFPFGAAQDYVFWQFPAHMFCFALGITLANIFTRARISKHHSRLFQAFTSPEAGTCYFVAGLALVLVPMYALMPTSPFVQLASVPAHPQSPWLPAWGTQLANIYFEDFEGLGFSLILAGCCFGLGAIRTLFSIAPLRILGILSYSLYLVHLPILFNVRATFTRHDISLGTLFLHYLVATFILSVLVSTLLYFAVEKRFIVWARRKPRGAEPAFPSAQTMGNALSFTASHVAPE